jgi:hypothetical protein
MRHYTNSPRSRRRAEFRARIGTFDDEMLRDIELDENTCRLDLTPSEAAAERLRSLERDAAAAIGNAVVTDRKRGPKPGTAAILSGGDKDRRNALKVEMSRNRKHVAAAEAHPVECREGKRLAQAGEGH